VDEHLRLLGLVTDRDVVAAVARYGLGNGDVSAHD
jgi:CBS domain-containing protein